MNSLVQSHWITHGNRGYTGMYCKIPVASLGLTSQGFKWANKQRGLEAG